MSNMSKALELHKKGKFEIRSKVPLANKEDLSLAYTPGVAEPCMEIFRNKTLVYDYTSKWNTVAVVTDGSAVLGLGNIGPEAALPVMEGKALLFKEFANIDAIPICLGTQDTDEIVKTVKYLAPSFGGINLEDISAPRCFEIEERLKEELDIPVFHDDQHGTAVVVLAGLINALQVVGKTYSDARVVISGAGAAGIATTRLLQKYGFWDIILVDSKGIIYEGRHELNYAKKEIAKTTNKHMLAGSLGDAMKGADVFIGLSAPCIVTKEMVKSMREPIIFAMANPVPEIMPDEARYAGARVMATGRSDFPNQINNVLAFPGIFRGALDARIKKITDEMKIAAAKTLANIVEEPTESYIIPDVFNKNVVKRIAEAVKNDKKGYDYSRGS